MHYRWHPAFDCELEIRYVEVRRAERVFVCAMADTSTAVIPAWMFDVALCAGMAVGAPRVSVEALLEVRALLGGTRFDCGPCAEEVRREEGHDEESEEIEEGQAKVIEASGVAAAGKRGGVGAARAKGRGRQRARTSAARSGETGGGR